ncbi:MAG: EAL domain-containing protein [Pseudomonadota bacterium]
MKRFRLSVWLSLGLVSLTLALVLASYVLGLLPDGRYEELKSRAKVAESLAVQLAGAANRNDKTALEETISSVVNRNTDVVSAALRGADGDILISAGDHENKWIKAKDGKSTPTHVAVPLLGPEGKQGAIEIVFLPTSSGTLFLGVPKSILGFLGFIIVSGFFAYGFFLKRTLHQLDPGRVIPERVQKSFDTLSEGVILIDEKERILLVNKAFASIHDGTLTPGTKINSLPWRMVDGSAQSGGYPWHTALHENNEKRQDLLSLRNENGSIHNFKVNATVISGAKEKAIGAIVTLSDITNIKRKEDALVKATLELEEREKQIAHQEAEIAFLSNHDSLSGCLNQRALMENLTWSVDALSDVSVKEPGAAASGLSASGLSVLMIDVDGFGRINAQHGPVAADRVVSALGAHLRTTLGETNPVGRRGGDRFCIVLNGISPQKAHKCARDLQRSITKSSSGFAPGGKPLTVCIGVAHWSADGTPAHRLVERAERSLFAAKQFSANSLVEWNAALGEAGTNAAHRPKATRSAKAAMTDKKPTAGFSDSPSQETSVLAYRATLNASERAQLDTACEQTAFFEKLSQSIATTRAAERPMAVLHLAILAWEFLEEVWGPEACANILQQVKGVLCAHLRESDGICLLPHDRAHRTAATRPVRRRDVTWVTKKLIKALQQPFLVGDKTIYISSKVGVALCPEDGTDADMLVRNAGIAMRRAQDEDGLNGVKFYSSQMAQTALERIDIEAGIRSALQQDEFELFFQPIVDAQTGALSAAEALLRCNNDQLRGVYMDKVINVAEESALIADIDEWVVARALDHMQAWCDRGLNLPKVSINISGKQLLNMDFMDRIFERISAVKFAPSRVQIEVTETAKLSDVETAASQLKRLQHLGVQIALDDFGTGQSSLTYLQRLHPDVIKIDRSFVTGVNSNHANATLVGAMTVMAHCLGLKVVVEGVEEQAELDFLRETRCDEIQGYFFSKPLPVPQLEQWVATHIQKHGHKDYAGNPGKNAPRHIRPPAAETAAEAKSPAALNQPLEPDTEKVAAA